MTGPRLLLLSNSKNPGQGYLEHARGALRDFLGAAIREVWFVPHAAVRLSWEEYTLRVREAFSEIGVAVRSVSETADPAAAVRGAEAVAVGGGNTFHLLKGLRETGLLQVIHDRARDGMPYLGWSAGANVACPTIMTTNDMPVVEVPSFAALGLVPFQINPHYTEATLPQHQGETRDERIAEFVELNPKRFVVGLREGSMLLVEGPSVRLLGGRPARIFLKGREARDCSPEKPLDFLLRG